MEKIHEKVSVMLTYKRETGELLPWKMKWQGRIYTMKKLAYYHKARQGRIIMHVFHVTDGDNDYKLLLNSDTLHWVLDEIVYGGPTAQ